MGDQGLLSRARVVVGLSGGGSHVVQQLVHAGVGTTIGIHDDRCDPTKLHRQIGMRPDDALVGTYKTGVMARLTEQIGTGARFVGIEGRVPEPRTLEALMSADVIVGCVDNLHARADVMEVAWRYGIPYVDVGANVRALDAPAAGPRVAIGGNVFVFIPRLLRVVLRVHHGREAAPRARRPRRSFYFENKAGQAQVVSFNAVVAGQAVSEVLQLLTAYRGSSIDPADLRTSDGQQRGALKYDGLRGTLDDWGASRRAGCSLCSGALAAGALLWRPAA